MLTISNLTKRFGTKVAVNIAGYTIPQGTMLGLVGNNGAGKTTTVGKLPHNNDNLSKEYLNKMFDKYHKKLIALKNAGKECSDLEKTVEELKQWQQ